MPLTSIQVRMARAAIGWTVRQLATEAHLSPDTVTRAEQAGADITEKTWAAFQRALEEKGIEFLPDTNSVAFHPDLEGVAICADPSMPLGVRRIYPR